MRSTWIVYRKEMVEILRVSPAEAIEDPALKPPLQIKQITLGATPLPYHYQEVDLKDPFVLEFLNLKDVPEISESDIEQSLLDHLQEFLLEFGKGFSFVARQKRITSGRRSFLHRSGFL